MLTVTQFIGSLYKNHNTQIGHLIINIILLRTTNYSRDVIDDMKLRI